MYSSVLNKRINGLWGKRLSKLWGKRSDSDSDELYQNALREFYDYARRNQFNHPQYAAYNGCKLNSVTVMENICIYIFFSFIVLVHPLTLKQLYAQRARFDEENEDTPENMS